MRRTPPIRVLVAAFIALAFTAFGARALMQGQAPPVSPATRAPGATPTQTAAPDATASVTGQVMAADTGAPVKRARVTVMGGTPPARPQGAEAGAAVPLATLTSGASGPSLPPGMVRRETETSATGRFEFAGLPAGRLVITTQAPAGFLFPTPQTVEVAAGASASVTIRLDRAGAITGRVLDHEGDPFVRAQVNAYQRRSVGGAWRMTTTGSASTDDLGQFRLFGLAPGDFYVRAAYNTPSAMAVAPGAGPRLGYAPTFYPSALDIDGAQKVSVRKGQDTVGIEVVLQRAQVATVSGRATDSAGNPLAPRRGYVTLSQYLEGAGPSGGFGAQQQEDGTFSFQNVPPGRYLLSATAGMSEGPNGMPREGASRTVVVDGEDVIADIQTNTGATVSGRVVVEGTGAGPAAAASGSMGPERIMVSARPSDPMTGARGYSGGQPAPAAEDGTFQLSGLRGVLLPQASGPRAALKSVTYGGVDIMATGLTLAGTERIEGVTITLTTDTAMIDGTVTTAGGEPAEAWIIVFSDDETRWFPMSPFVRIVRTRAAAAASGGRSASTPPASPGGPVASAESRQAGGFAMPMLLPGRYAIVALPVNDDSSLTPGSSPATDRESLPQLRAGAKIVSLTAGQTATVRMQLKK